MSTQKRRKELALLRDEALQDYLNREDFQYDLNGDALYRQYKDRYMDMGKSAMVDTMGQASALTGGYGSSYAQSVGQQAYNQYLKELGDVVPELYRLAYDRYQDQSDRLYRRYEQYAQQEQDAAKELQWQQEQQEDQRRFDLQYTLSQQKQEKSGKKEQAEQTEPQPDYLAWLSYYQGQGTRYKSDDPSMEIKYDNQNVSTGNVMTMQRVLGMPETGMWTVKDKGAAGGMSADVAWRAYQRGQLQNRQSVALGDMGVSTGNVRAMERSLGLKDDGIWSKEDQEAAGGMSEKIAWEAYQRGLLPLRR